ncbi:MAG: Mrp/NBP35 family ATP-binding protein [Nitrospirae bacterium]|nr:Mrp/NBP35 family ATP-binding protein [Nitrospirota bacterium]
MGTHMTEDLVMNSLKKVIEPELFKDIVTLNMVKDLKINGKDISLTIVLTTPACPLKGEIQNRVEKAVKEDFPDAGKIDIHWTSNVTSGKAGGKENLIPTIKNTIAVSSGKGGVGKSTVTVNLAVALAQAGARVGLLDADVYGPNIPLMMGVSKAPVSEGGKLEPAESHQVKFISMAFMVEDDTPIVWRGPMIHGAIQQFLRDVNWGELDYLLIDLPPGTGDAQLSITQLIPLTGAIIVTTPQDVALLDSKRGLAMFQKVHVPLLGIVENMSYFCCPHCHEKTEIFSRGGGKTAADKLKVPFLGEIPIDPAIRVGGDTGRPIVVSDPDSPQARSFVQIAGLLAAQISVMNAKGSTLKIVTV